MILYQNEISNQKENFTAIENWNKLIPMTECRFGIM